MIGKFKKNTAGLDTRKIILKLAPPLKNAINNAQNFDPFLKEGCFL